MMLSTGNLNVCAADVSSSDGNFLEYREPDIVQILIIISFFFFLSFGEWLSDKIFRAGLIGQIVVGLIYGMPVANIMPLSWQETFVALGYVGLILIIFEGGLTVRLDMLKQNFTLSLFASSVGIIVPIALAFALLLPGYGYGAIETFIVGASLSSTSLGTTFVVIRSAVKDLDVSQTRVGIVLVSAAVIDDVSGLVMASVIHNLGSAADGSGSTSIGWQIGRPIVASAALGICSPLLAKFVFSPLFRRYAERHPARLGHAGNMTLMALVLCAHVAAAGSAGASVLLGAFLAGTFLATLPPTHTRTRARSCRGRAQGETAAARTLPAFAHTFDWYLLDAQTYILQPVFFASVGFAIPFRQLWTAQAIWRGLVFSVLMVVAKAAVGLCVPLWDLATRRPVPPARAFASATWAPAALLGTAMVARGEIGLVIIQVGLNETPFLSEPAFVTACWAIVLNTIVGPAAVGLLLTRAGSAICDDPRWGTQPAETEGWDGAEEKYWGWVRRWTNRRLSGGAVGGGDAEHVRQGGSSGSEVNGSGTPGGAMASTVPGGTEENRTMPS